jgi:hypothetical protein
MIRHSSTVSPSRDRRALLFGIAAIAAILGASRAVPTLTRWREEHLLSNAQVINDAERTRVLVHALPALRDSLRARRVRLAGLDSAVLEGESLDNAGAYLAELVSDAAQESESQLGSIQIEHGDTIALASHALRKVRLRASLTGDLEHLAYFLSALEEGPEVVAVRELSLVQPEPILPPTRVESLRADLVVEVLARVNSQLREKP